MKRCNLILILTLKSFLGIWEKRSLFFRYLGMKGLCSINSKKVEQPLDMFILLAFEHVHECTNIKLFLDLVQKTF